MAWEPKARILADTAESEPTKPSIPGFVGFEGATPAESPEMEAGPDPAVVDRASVLMNRAGVRLMQIDGAATIGVWSDLDGPAIRAALHSLEMEGLTVRYLDSEGIPLGFKVRRVAGEPVPLNVLAEMERNPADPWTVRDRMLNEMGWCPRGIAWTAWQAAACLGVGTGKPARLTPATSRHEERRIR